MKKAILSGKFSAFAFSSLLLLGVAFSACNKSNNNDNEDVPVAGLMAFNLAPDVSQASVTLGGNNLSSGPLAFNAYTGGYLAIYTGSRSVGSYNYNTGAELDAVTYDFQADKYYSVFVVGADTGHRNVVVQDNFDSLSATAGKAYVRYINAIPDASNPTVTIASNGTNVVNDNAAFASVSDFTAINTGEITINVTNGGSISANRTINVEERGLYTILLSGNPGGTGDQAVGIKYITNGTLDASTAKQSSVSAKAAK